MQLMAQLFIPLILLFSFQSALADQTSGSVTLNCQGKTKLCTDCPEQTFQFISVQTASVYNNQVQNEKHSFKFNGFLGKNGDYARLRATDKHIIYKNAKYLLSIPYVNQKDGFFAQKVATKNVQLAPNEKPEFDWVKLCE